MKWQHIAFISAFTFLVTYGINAFLPSTGFGLQLAVAALAGGLGGWLSLKTWKT